MSERIFYVQCPKHSGTEAVIDAMSKEEYIFMRYFSLSFSAFKELSLYTMKTHLMIKSVSSGECSELTGNVAIEINLRTLRFYQDKVDLVLYEFLTRFVMQKEKLNYKDATLHIYSKLGQLPTVYHTCIMKNLSNSAFSTEKNGVFFQVLLDDVLRDTWCHSVAIINNEELSLKNEVSTNLMLLAGEEARKYCRAANKPVNLPFVSPGGLLRIHWIIHIKSVNQIPEALLEADKRGCVSMMFHSQRVKKESLGDILDRMVNEVKKMLHIKYVQILANKSSLRTIKHFFKSKQ